MHDVEYTPPPTPSGVWFGEERGRNIFVVRFPFGRVALMTGGAWKGIVRASWRTFRFEGVLGRDGSLPFQFLVDAIIHIHAMKPFSQALLASRMRLTRSCGSPNASRFASCLVQANVCPVGGEKTPDVQSVQVM